MEAVAQGDVIYAHFQVAGVPDTTPFTVAFIDEDSQTILFKAQSQWKLGSGEQCTGAALKVPPAIHGADAVLIIGPQDEINVINPVKFG